MINDDIISYSKDFMFIKSFLDKLFENIGIGKINKGNSFIEFDNSLIANDFLQFKVSSENSIDLFFFIEYDNLRVDILNLPEIIEYSLEDIKKDYNKIYDELKDILTLKCIVTNRCGCYRLKFIDSNGKVIRKYTFGYGLLSVLTLCICPFVTIKKYSPICEESENWVR